MKNRCLYTLHGYIPSDENMVVMSLMKLITLGYKNKQYIWVNINYDGGIGVGVNDWGSESIEEVFINLNAVCPEAKIYKCTFEEILARYHSLKNRLEEDLK